MLEQKWPSTIALLTTMPFHTATNNQPVPTAHRNIQADSYNYELQLKAILKECKWLEQ